MHCAGRFNEVRLARSRADRTLYHPNLDVAVGEGDLLTTLKEGESLPIGSTCMEETSLASTSPRRHSPNFPKCSLGVGGHVLRPFPEKGSSFGSSASSSAEMSLNKSSDEEGKEGGEEMDEGSSDGSPSTIEEWNKIFTTVSSTANSSHDADTSHGHVDAASRSDEALVSSQESSHERVRAEGPFKGEGGGGVEFNAVKIVSKDVFWTRVQGQKERSDALVREVLAQVLLSSHFLAPTSLFNLERSYGQRGPPSPFLPSALWCLSDGNLPIVQILGVFESMDHFVIEMEYMEGRDLHNYLLSTRDCSLPERHVCQIVSQLVDAVSLCSRLGIAHRDIKLTNITIPKQRPAGSETDEFFAIKLADFGMAGFVGADRKLKGRCGTAGYVAPDILRARPNDSYHLNVDMFSVHYTKSRVFF